MKVFTKVMAISVLMTISMSQLKAQTEKEVIGNNPVNAVTAEEHPTVINEKMLQRMLSSYENANVVDWVDVFTQNNFTDVKLFLAAYNSIDFNAIGERNIVDVVNDKVQEIKSVEANKNLLTDVVSTTSN